MSGASSSQNVVRRTDIESIEGLPDSLREHIGKTVKLNDIGKILDHKDFRIKEATPYVEESIKRNSDIVFHPIKMQIEEFGKWNDKESMLMWHGRGEDNRPIILIVRKTHCLFYLRRPDNVSDDKFNAQVLEHIKLNKKWQSGVVRISRHMAKRCMYFEPDKRLYLKLEFKNLSSYYDAKKYFEQETRIKIACGAYSRKKLHLQILKEYPNFRTYEPMTFKYAKHCNPYPREIVNDIDIFVVDPENIKPLDMGDPKMRPTQLSCDYLMISHDAETGSKTFGEATKYTDPDMQPNIWGFTVYRGETKVLNIVICTSDKVTDIENCLTIVCKDVLEMIIAFAEVFKRLRPSIEIGYNTWGFDWPTLIYKSEVLGIAQLFFSKLDMLKRDYSWITKRMADSSKYAKNARISKKYMISRNIKVSPTDVMDIYYPDMISFVSIDLFVMFIKKNPGGKFSGKSMDYWLMRHGLPLKYNMPYSQMHEVYNKQLLVEGGDATIDVKEFSKEITEMCVYCVHDTAACASLCFRTDTIKDVFITASINHCTISEAIMDPIASLSMDALVNVISFRRGYMNSDVKSYSNDPRGVYLGAKIIQPKRGLTKAKPTVREMASLNKKWKDVTEEEYVMMELACYNNIEDPISELVEGAMSEKVFELFKKWVAMPIRSPVVPYDFASMYPHIMKENNSSMEQAVHPKDAEKIRALGYKLKECKRSWDNDTKSIHMFFVQRDEDKPETNALVVDRQFDLLDLRNEVKNKMKVEKRRMVQINDANLRKQIAVDVQSMDIEQRTLKVSMNSYYGKTKAAMYEIACETTMGGRDRLGALVEACKRNGWNKIIYGDTDSVYTEMPQKLGNDIHGLYYGGKLRRREYYNKLIERSLEEGDRLAPKLNQSLRDMGYPYMRVAKEETLFPTLNVCDKTYVGAAHEHGPNFKEDGTCNDYTTRKMGKRLAQASNMLVELSTRMSKTLLSIENDKSYKEIAADVIKYAYDSVESGEWPLEMFAKRATYRGKQNNVTNFINLMKIRGRTDIPKLNEKFKYVFIRDDSREFDIYGNKSKNGRAGIMELYDVVKANPDKYKINLGVYLEQVQTELGQMICADPDENVKDMSSSQEDMHLAARQTTAKGRAFIKYLCDLQTGKPADSKLGKKVHSMLFKKIANYTRPTLRGHYHSINKIYKQHDSYDVFVDMIDKQADKFVISELNTRTADMKDWNAKQLEEAIDDHDEYFEPEGVDIEMLKHECDELLRKLKDKSVELNGVAADKKDILSDMMHRYKALIGIDKNILTDEDYNNAMEKISAIDISVDENYSDIDISKDSELMNECNSLCKKIVDKKKYIDLDSEILRWMTIRLNKKNGLGTSVSRAEIDDIINDINGCVACPDMLNI